VNLMHSSDASRDSATGSTHRRRGVLLVTVGTAGNDASPRGSSAVAEQARALQAELPQDREVFTATVYGKPAMVAVLKRKCSMRKIPMWSGTLWISPKIILRIQGLKKEQSTGILS